MATTAGSPSSSSVTHGVLQQAPPLVQPPEAFALVEPGVYRSTVPQPVQFPFLRSLGLRTVVYLSPEFPMRSVQHFFAEQSIEAVHLGLSVWRPKLTWKPVSESLMKIALEICLDVTRHPVMLVDTSGVHQTGTLVGCLRRLQHWSLSAILSEYRAFAGTMSRAANEQFIELFDVDLVVLPPRLPPWFEAELRMWRQDEDAFDDHVQRHRLSQEDQPAYKRYQWASSSRLVSPGVAWSTKLSIVDDDDD